MGTATTGASCTAPVSPALYAETRSRLAASLRARLPELLAAIATRVHAIADPCEVADPVYPERLKAALDAAVAHRLEVLEAGARRAPAIPPILLAQARLDARDNVPLDTVLRRYFAGNSVFGDFLVEEAERAGTGSSMLRRLLAEQATEGERLLAVVSAEHAREVGSRPRDAASRRRACTKALLAGELIDASELDYDLDGHHLALMVRGEGVEGPLREVAAALDRRLLAVNREEEPVWACWLGGRRPVRIERVVACLAEALPGGVYASVGEPAAGLAGWRLSHRQAKAALPLVGRGGGRLVRYADVAVQATIVGDELAVASLRQIYLEPLVNMRDGGVGARETLRAYFAAGRNASSTAAALGIDRRTVGNRLGAVESALGRPLGEVAADLEIALRVDAAERFPDC